MLDFPELDVPLRRMIRPGEAGVVCVVSMRLMLAERPAAGPANFDRIVRHGAATGRYPRVREKMAVRGNARTGRTVDLESVADELYGLPPGEFTAARDERASRARRSGDRALADRIRALRRPTLAAWLSNLLVRRDPDQVEPLLALGRGLRAAQRELDGRRLRELSRQRQALVGALARQAALLAAETGEHVTEHARREVEATFHAVLADPDAAGRWAAGRLTSALSAPVGLDADAVPARAPAPDDDPGRRREQRHRDRLDRARRDADAAERSADAAETAHRDADRRASQAARLLAEAEERVRSARRDADEATAAAREAGSAARRARRRARDAAARADRLAAPEA